MNDDDSATLDGLLDALSVQEQAWLQTQLQLPAPEPTTRDLDTPEVAKLSGAIPPKMR